MTTYDQAHRLLAIQSTKLGTDKAMRDGPYRQVGRVLRDVTESRRNRMLAETLGSSPDEVAGAAMRLYDRSAQDEIQSRFSHKLRDLDDDAPESDSATWRAHRSHAIRAVTRELRQYLLGGGA